RIRVLGLAKAQVNTTASIIRLKYRTWRSTWFQRSSRTLGLVPRISSLCLWPGSCTTTILHSLWHQARDRKGQALPEQYRKFQGLGYSTLTILWGGRNLRTTSELSDHP